MICLLTIIVLLSSFPIKINSTPSDHDLRAEFRNFVIKYNKSYANNLSEYRKRFNIFKSSIDTIDRLNSLRDNPDSAVYGITQFSDQSELEFRNNKLKRSHSGCEKHLNDVQHFSQYDTIADNNLESTVKFKHKRSSDSLLPMGDLPLKVDWRDKGVVSPVRTQGKCGACWAHSVLETIESLIAIKHNSSVVEELSVQQAVDCAQGSNYGCIGGNTCSLLKWLVENNVTIANTTTYPYLSNGWMGECKTFDVGTPGPRVHNFTCQNVVSQEYKLIEFLAYHGPVVAAVNAISWQNYWGGVIQYHCYGSLHSVNHAVEIIGYDFTSAIPHYIIRNTWGTAFGDNGYIKIKFGKNLCGIATEVSFIFVD